MPNTSVSTLTLDIRSHNLLRFGNSAVERCMVLELPTQEPGTPEYDEWKEKR